ncbi:hypothetical protein LINPERHAP2_LOCUS35521, partial [Linum perenne]
MMLILKLPHPATDSEKSLGRNAASVHANSPDDVSL